MTSPKHSEPSLPRIEGRTAAANVEPHRDQWLLFFKYQNTRSLYPYHHHNTLKQQQTVDNTT
jgi:hypothetical protein